MTSPASPYIAPEGSSSDKKWWDPFGLFASKPAPSNPPSDFTPSATAGRRKHRAKTEKALEGGRKRSHTKKAGGRRHRGKKHSRK
jgi:hypothetical protein|uniref:Uncharacterized protein n=1 Tax=viral metagenome TaxID=1070528 RepID=A0A6C0K9A2_9ZZZZ